MKSIIAKSISQLMIILFFCFGITQAFATDLEYSLSIEFVDGFKTEVANRNFSRLTSIRMSKRYEEKPMYYFWQSYHRLELLNVQHYAKVAKQWEVAVEVSSWSKVKAYAIELTPDMFIDSALKSALSITKDYVEFLRRLKSVGPKSADNFLNYMTEQEVLQVELIPLALDGKYLEAKDKVDAFIAVNPLIK